MLLRYYDTLCISTPSSWARHNKANCVYICGAAITIRRRARPAAEPYFIRVEYHRRRHFCRVWPRDIGSRRSAQYDDENRNHNACENANMFDETAIPTIVLHLLFSLFSLSLTHIIYKYLIHILFICKYTHFEIDRLSAR